MIEHAGERIPRPALAGPRGIFNRSKDDRLLFIFGTYAAVHRAEAL